MYQLCALYAHPEDPAVFDEHYRTVHAPLAAKVPGITSFTMAWCRPGADGSKPPYHLIATLYADSREAMEAGLGGPEGQAAVADLANFAGAGVEMVFSDSEQVV